MKVSSSSLLLFLALLCAGNAQPTPDECDSDSCIQLVPDTFNTHTPPMLVKGNLFGEREGLPGRYELRVTQDSVDWLSHCAVDFTNREPKVTHAQYWKDGGPETWLALIEKHIGVPRISNETLAREQNETPVGGDTDAHVRAQNETHVTQKCVVLDVGGHRGQFVQWMWDRFRCHHIYAFEPYPEYIEHLQNRFAHAQKHIHVIPYALSHQAETVKIFYQGDATSIHKTYAESYQNVMEKGEIRTQTLFDFFYHDYHAHDELIDVLSINCEGCEYTLLQHMINNGLHTLAKLILIQFHYTNLTDYFLMCEIHHHLAHTHTRVLYYPYAWELWVRNDLPQ
eukprot:GDKI01028421.1.p1 GENE.GDKI01028421.1~~GDKI01028421.1.p1  ORF type:complete len:339 (-),score=63.04 GDKI01028421.1:24-1040(-)